MLGWQSERSGLSSLRDIEVDWVVETPTGKLSIPKPRQFSGMYGRSLCGNREVSGSTGGWTPPARTGKARNRSR